MQFVRLTAAAWAFGTDEGTLRCWARAGKVPGVRRAPNGRYFIEAETAAAWWAGSMVCAEADRPLFREALVAKMTRGSR